MTIEPMREHRVMQRVRMALVAGLALTPAVAASSTWVVDPAGPLSSIQAAIEQAHPGDVVLVQPGVYHERLVLREGVSLVAPTPGSVTVDAEAEGPAVTAAGISSATTISGFIFTHGSSSAGGGLSGAAVDAVFSQCTFVDNSAALGGGAYLHQGSRATFASCTFSGNVASVGGGFYLDFAAIQISGSTVRDNHAQDGAALSANNAAEANVSTTSFYGNVATDGTVIACNLASPRFVNCTIAANTCGLGVIAMRGSASRIERSIVAGNSGPALVCDGFNSPWVGCSLFWGNANDTICGGDQGTNLFVDPRFCNPAQDDFQLAADSPAATVTCGILGAEPVACPAQGVETALRDVDWSAIKKLFRN
jgi:hypothetical protein